MIIHANGKDYTPPELLIYWIQEREAIRIKKETGHGKPWSNDHVFQTTYFCNVHREDDKVTRFIRRMYNPYYDDPMFVYNIVLARFINWPNTLSSLGYLEEHKPHYLKAALESIQSVGKVWGGAYIITTHGQKMNKVDYLVDQVLKDIVQYQTRYALDSTLCQEMSNELQRIDGIGSFLAGQIVADLKNTPGHPLASAPDKETFVVPGPGSMRGVSWFRYGHGKFACESEFEDGFPLVREYVDQHWPESVAPVDNQDLQNCLCEYDKYCRVATGMGRSKRHYPGTKKGE